MITEVQSEKMCDCKRSPDDLIYDLMKLAEENNELATVVLQYLNKPHKREVLEQKIIDEIGDVVLRIGFLEKNWNGDDFRDRVRQRINEKINRICR